MEAQTLNCPMCGAASKCEATRCLHCGARLATVACPSCFGMVFLGARFCSHCGGRVDRPQDSAPAGNCPRCRVSLAAIKVGSTDLQECSKCGGIWADVTSLEQIRTDRERQAAILGEATPLPGNNHGVQIEKNIRYLPCPECGKLMNRVNFARCSNVIVDVCRGHGTWFDRDELRHIIEFIRAGGLDAARQREIAQLEQQRRQLNAEKTSARQTAPWSGTEDYADYRVGIGSVARLLGNLLR